jgi:hypothetical protein
LKKSREEVEERKKEMTQLQSKVRRRRIKNENDSSVMVLIE